MSFPRYKSYVAAGSGWLSEVPSHWSVLANKALLTNQDCVVGDAAQAHVLLSLTLKGVIVRDVESGKGKFPAEFDTYKNVTAGDLIFCLFDVDETPRTVGLAAHHGMITGAYEVLRAKPNVLARFILYFYLHVDAFKGLRPWYTGLRKVVRPDTFMAIKIAVPPLSEQLVIVALLDQETAKIDALIGEQRRLIELLKEKRQAVISHVVTSRVEPGPDGATDENGVAVCWKTTHLKRLATRISKGTTPTTVGAHFTASGIRFIKAENITPTGVSETPEFFIAEETHELLRRSSLEVSDVLVVIAGATTGKSAVMTPELLPANTNQAVSFVRLRDNRYAAFVNLWLSMKTVQDEILLNSVQSAQPNHSMEDLGNISIALPPADQLGGFFAFLNKSLDRLKRLSDSAVCAIALLQERRSALISAAVTGKIDIRSYKPQPSAVAEETHEPA